MRFLIYCGFAILTICLMPVIAINRLAHPIARAARRLSNMLEEEE
jgi:lauroyl/myristoyl acyltransferase